MSKRQINTKPRKKPHKKEVVIEEIKRVWRPGMTARQIAERFGKHVDLSADSVTKYFKKWATELEPCYLQTKAARKKAQDNVDELLPAKFEPLNQTYVNSNGITLPKVFRD